jgi:capsular exopolysaccharide synthesis family protein
MMSQDNRLMPIPAVDRTALERPLSDLNAARSYGPAANEPTQFRDYLFVVLKRKWLILSVSLVVTSLVAVQMFRQPSIYQAVTTIRIEQRKNSVLQTDKLVINQNDPNFWGTQLKLLQSPALARQVALTLDLQHNPSFFSSQSQGGFFAALRRMVSGDQRRTKATPAPPSKLDLVGEAQLREQPLTDEELAALEPYEDAIIGNEDIEGIVNTNLFVIKFRHHDPDIAQKVANTLAEVFQNTNLERSSSNTSKQETVLLKEIGDLQFKVKHDTEVLFNYARENNLSPTNNPTHDVEGQRLSSLSNQMLAAENDRKIAEAVYNAAKNAQDPFTVPEVLKSEWISKVRNEMGVLKDKRDALLYTYTKEWPEVKKIDATLKLKEAELGIAVKQQIDSLKSRLESARAHEQSIRTMYLSQRETTSSQTRAQIEMAAYTQKLETDKQYLNTLQQRLREIQVTTGDRGNEVSIENPSRLPKTPIGPARLRNVGIALLLSLVAGVGLAFLLDFLDDTVKSLDDIDRYVHLPALALIPASKSTPGRLKGLAPSPATGPSESTALAMVEDVRSPVAESYRHLRTSLLLSSAGQPPKTILVTSSQPSEGKTTTAINTAFMLAQTGVEVLIIDCDLRRPRLHAQFEVSNARGLTTWLSGERELDGLLHAFPKTPNLKILTSGPVPPNPAELLGSDEMRRLLSELSERFTHIIIDSPPAISFTDASILSTMVDGVMLVVHGGRSSRAVVRRAKQQLVDVGAHIFGVVLNNVRMETQDYYYSGYYSDYYSSPDADAAPGDSSRETA